MSFRQLIQSLVGFISTLCLFKKMGSSINSEFFDCF